MKNKFIINKPELLSPAGDKKKGAFPIIYGADAIYIGTKNYSLRYNKNFSDIQDLKYLSDVIHKFNKKFYFTTNIFMHNMDLNNFIDEFSSIDKVNPDAYIVSDPSIVEYLNKKFKKRKLNSNSKYKIKKREIHLSTQANTLNFKRVEFWYRQGVDRVILARELTLKEIEEIKNYINEKKLKVKLETFIHGAMCISYSGRCLLSFYMTSPNLSKSEGIYYRDANKGMCVHPCRWEFKVIEKKRENEIFEVIEDSNYSYFMSSKDLCLLKYLPFLVIAGIDSFKIEGRMKSEFYQGITTFVYRKAIDIAFEIVKDFNKKDIDFYLNNKDRFFKDFNKWNDFVNNYFPFLDLYSHRPYSTGFYFIDSQLNEEIRPTNLNYQRDSIYLGYVIWYEDLENISYKDIFKNLFNFDNNFYRKLKELFLKIILRDEKEIKKKNYLYLFYCKNKWDLSETVKLVGPYDKIMDFKILKAYDLELNKVEILKHSNYYLLILDNYINSFSFIIKQ
ncbi:MAG: U32 family peptidase [Spirochaetes bacterium]|nr:U32 family peptidase [Spirochaetota bacterium]